MEASWRPVGGFLGVEGPLGHLGVSSSQGQFEFPFLGPSWSSLRSALGAYWGILGLSSAVLGPSFGRLLGCLLGRLGGRPSKNARTLKPFKKREKIIGWELWRPSWELLSRLGAILGRLGALLGRHGGHWKRVGIPRSFWDGSEEAPGTLSSSSPPFTCWGASWAVLGRYVEQ